ncbi:MAG: EAL domain-containing protein [Gammaproteobacteria bacterium]|nr:EAL domain-containing protein [Gammaproteobacteria bacterium]
MNLCNKIVVFVTSLVLLLGGLTIGIYSYLVDKSMTTLQENWGSLVSQFIAESTANSVVNNNTLQLNRIIQPIVSKNRDIEYVYVVDADKNIIAHTYTGDNLTFFKKLLNHEKETSYSKIKFNDKDIIDFSYPVVAGLATHVHIGVNNTSINKIESVLIRNVLIFYGVVGTLFIIIGRLMAMHIVKPITNVIEQMNKFGRNRYGGELKINSDDAIIQKLVFTFNDMTEKRIKNEQALRVSEENTRLLLNHIGEAVYGIDMEGNCTFVNPACVKLLGYSRASELEGKNMHQLIHHHYKDGSEYPEHECHIFKVLNSGVRSHNTDEVFWCKDGSALSVEYWSDPLYREGDIIGSVISFVDITDRKRIEEDIEKNRQSLTEAQQISNTGNWEWNIKTGELIWSDQIFRIFGMEPGSIVPDYDLFIDFVHPEDSDRLRMVIQESLERDKDYEIEHRIIISDKSVRFVREQGRIFYENGVPVKMSGTVQDITSKHEENARMSMLSSALEQSADLVLITNNKGMIEYINPAFESTTGYTRDEMIGSRPDILKSGKMEADFYSRLWDMISSGGTFTGVFINKKKNGIIYYEEKTITPLINANGNITHYISTGKDISERMATQERLHHMAHHDALTGLPNRLLLLDRLDQVTSRARWHNRVVGVMFLDMDRFKTINDTLGHDVGDNLLKQMSLRLSHCVRDGDTVARLGGDEFAIILNDVASIDDISPFAQKIIEALMVPFSIHEHELFVTSSIGICVYPDDGDNSQELLKRADVAMYRAKAMGRNNFQFYTEEDNTKAIERLKMENELRRALERNEFKLHFQPQLDLHEGKLAGMEALLRWYHPEYGIVPPAIFIPLLEETGLIVPVGEWVIRNACQHARSWLDHGLHFRRIAVNLSVRQFSQPGLAGIIKNILDEERLGAHFLELEITENLLVDNIAETSRMLNELHKMGVYISIDDFGTGYSSMNYLKRLPVDALKIDYSFVRDITLDPEDATIASAIVTLAHSLGLTVIAEGVETLGQLNFLLNEGCDQIQGFLFSPPLPAEAVQHLILEGSVYWEWEHILRERRWNKNTKKVS